MKHIHISEDRQFWLHDGRVLQNLHELQHVLSDMSPATFKHHVSSKHNDFAKWINDILGDAKFAGKLKKARSSKNMIALIDKALANAQMHKITDINHLNQIANKIRQDTIKTLLAAGSGHSAGPLGMADVFAALYFNVLNHKPRDPTWDGRDRFVLSNGHICPVRYVAMAHSGYFPQSELNTLRKLNTRLQGHPHNTALPGVESTGGPLGQGTSVAVGMALAARMDGKKHQVYCMVGDGETNEGQVWEAFMLAGKEKLHNLTVIVDRNNIQIDGMTETIMPLEPLADKFRAFGFHVIDVDAHNIQQVIDACSEAKSILEKPTAIIAHAIPGKGVDFMETKYEWHGKPPNAEEAKIALHELRTLGGKIRSEHE